MINLLDKHEDKFWFFIYIAGSGGEKTIDSLTKNTSVFYNYGSTHDEKYNKWALKQTAPNRILHNLTTYEPINNKTSHLNQVTSKMPTGSIKEIVTALEQNKLIMTKGHTFHHAIPQVFSKSKFIYLYFDDYDSQQTIHKLRFIKNWLPLKEGKFSIHAKGSSSSENLERAQHRYADLFNRIDDSNMYRSFLFDLLIRITDEELAKLNLGDLNSYSIDELFSIEFAHTIYQKCINNRGIDHKTINQFNLLKSTYINNPYVNFLNFRDLTNSEEVCKIMYPHELDSKGYLDSMKKWSIANQQLINEMTEQFKSL